MANKRGVIEMKELSLTKGRHEIKSVFTGKVIEKSIFGHTVEDVLDIEKHMEVAREAMFYEQPYYDEIVVYVTGLTPCFKQYLLRGWMFDVVHLGLLICLEEL